MTVMDWMAQIDWSALGSVLQGIGTVAGAIAIIVAARLGSSTFNNWRQQKLSERLIEQAERILTATYKVRRGLAIVRNPAIFAHELSAAEEHLRETGEWDKIADGDDRRERYRSAQAYYNRLNSTIDDRRALEECQPMARALFGEVLEKALETLNRQFRTVSVYVDAKYRDGGSNDKTLREKIDVAIYSGWPSPEENEMDRAIADQVKVIEGICVPVLRLESGRRDKG